MIHSKGDFDWPKAGWLSVLQTYTLLLQCTCWLLFVSLLNSFRLLYSLFGKPNSGTWLPKVQPENKIKSSLKFFP